MSAVVIARGLSHEFANGRELFHDLDCSIADSLTALVGPNGVGKTYLARILAGDVMPTRGVVQRRGSVRYFAQREAPRPITVGEYLSDRYEWSLTADRLLRDVPFDAACTHLSGGQWMRVRLANALGEDFLILDEPSNDLDRAGRDALAVFLRERRNGTLLISHDPECLQLCSDVLELSNRGLAHFGVSWKEYEIAMTQERERLHAVLDLAKRERDAAHAERIDKRTRQEKRGRQGAAAARRGGMPKILLGARKRQAQASSGKLDVATLEKANDAVRDAFTAFTELKIDPVMYAEVLGRENSAQRLIAAAQDFNIRFDDWLYPCDLNFDWRGNARLALCGPNGAGKSTLLKALTGVSFATRGELRRGSLATLYLDQHCSVLDEATSVLDNVRATSAASDSELRNGLARFLFAGDTVFQRVSNLSGGERLRAALAKGFLSADQPELLLLDEPTNNLDAANVDFLAGVVNAFRGALIVVSHDRRFVERCGIEADYAPRNP